MLARLDGGGSLLGGGAFVPGKKKITIGY